MIDKKSAEERENELFEYAKKMDYLSLEEGWQILYENGLCVLVAILRDDLAGNKPFGIKGYVSLYTISYRMCSNAGSNDYSKALYDRSKLAIETVLQQVVADLKKNYITGIDLLRKFAQNWSNHKVITKWMQQLFRHLDNGYVANSSVPTLTSVGLRAFYDYVFLPLKFDVRDALLFIIDKNRDGIEEDIDFTLVRNCVDIFYTMGLCLTASKLSSLQAALSMEPINLELYIKEFETYFLSRTVTYYTKKSQIWLQTDTAPTYLRRVQTVLEEERSRALHCLHASTLPKLILVCQEELIDKHKSHLVHHQKCGMHFLLANEKLNDLKLMFVMFRQVPQGLAPMANSFQKYILNCGNSIIKAHNTTNKDTATHDNICSMIERLLLLHKNSHSMIRELFENEHQFQQALRTALQDIINHGGSSDDSTPTVVEIIALYLDRVLSGKIRLSEEALELKLDELLQLFLLIADKDLFAEIYRERLAKRLLNRRFISLHAEKIMIIKMKTQQGAPFTTKLEGMVNDFGIGEDLAKLWQAHYAQIGSGKNDGENNRKNSILTSSQTSMHNDLHLKPSLEFSVQVLTQGFWPAQKFRELHLTRELTNAKNEFDQWYKARHSHRLLTWIYALGEATVRATFHHSKKYDISLSTFQAVTLLLFNSASSLSFQSICDSLGLDVATGKRILHSLACGKHKILIKTGQPKSINHSQDEFRINCEFSSKLKRFSIPIPSLDAESRKDINLEVQQQRGYNIDATLVRIMKARKRLTHQELIGEVIHQIQNFTPEIKLLRQRIEALIERGYIQRDDADPRSYIYLP